MKKILYVSGFKDDYDEKVFIQRRKKAVLQHFEECDCVIHFLHNSPGGHPLGLKNAEYHHLLYCNVAESKLQKIHHIWFKHSAIYAKIIVQRIAEILPFQVDDYDLIVAEGWVIAAALIPLVSTRKIIARIYGTSDLTERIEQNVFWRINPFFRKVDAVVNSNKIRCIIFNSTGSRSRDLFELLLRAKEGGPQPVYLDMPNVLFRMEEEKKRMVHGSLILLHVGRMIENRGFDLTLRILDILRNQNRIPVRAVLVGDGPVRDSLQEMCRHLNLSDCVHFTGRLNLDQLRKYYGEADILLNCYGFNPVIEALNYKAYAITREFGEMKYIFDRYYSEKAFKVCASDYPRVNITEDIKDGYLTEAVSAVKWYCKNYRSIAEEDFIPRIPVDLDAFAHEVFRYYHDALFS